MRIYYTGTDGGDGSIGVKFFSEDGLIEKLEEADPETYRGEGGGSFECSDFPESMLTTAEEVADRLGESTD